MSTETPQQSRAIADGAVENPNAPTRPASPAHGAAPRAERAPAPRPDVAPAPPAAASEPAAGTTARSRRPLVLGVVTLAALALAGFGVRHLLYARHHVSTDDAQVEGHIIPILPRVAGYVATVDVSENQQVRAGQTLA